MQNTPPMKIVDGYLAIILDDSSQKELLRRYPSLYPKVFAHHVTIAFKPLVEVYEHYEKYLGSPVTLTAYGYAKDEKAEAILVGADIFKDEHFHITLSTNGVAPVYSNALIQKGYETIPEPFTLQAKFEFIKHERK